MNDEKTPAGVLAPTAESAVSPSLSRFDAMLADPDAYFAAARERAIAQIAEQDAWARRQRR